MRLYYSGLFLTCLCFVLACGVASAQDETLAAAAGDRYVISAKAGGVNFVEGAVSVARKTGKSGYLTKGDALEIGDKVSTGSASKAEILLNPGSYLRLGDNARFEFVTTGLDDLQLKVESGSAILEVFAAEEFKVAITTPKSKYLLIESGIYRIDVADGGDERLEVWKGSARLGNAVDAIKPGRAVTVGASGSSIAKFDRGKKDALEIWSKARSKQLAKITDTLSRDLVRTALMRSFLGNRWNVFSAFGLWILDPRFGGYVFLPFGYGWGSPYGYGYGHSLGWYDLPPVIWTPPHNGGGNTGGPPVTPTTPTTPTVTPITTRGDRSPIPPFVRMQQTMGGGREGIDDRSGTSYDPGSSTPTYSPSSSSSPTKSEPAPTKYEPAPTKIDVTPPPTKQPLDN